MFIVSVAPCSSISSVSQTHRHTYNTHITPTNFVIEKAKDMFYGAHLLLHWYLLRLNASTGMEQSATKFQFFFLTICFFFFFCVYIHTNYFSPAVPIGMVNFIRSLQWHVLLSADNIPNSNWILLQYIDAPSMLHRCSRCTMKNELQIYNKIHTLRFRSGSAEHTIWNWSFALYPLYPPVSGIISYPRHCELFRYSLP